MFSTEITSNDAFLDMPQTTQNLYFHLGMSADDDGFIGNPKMVMRVLGSSQNDYDMLVAKKYILHLERGICVVKHWRINNQIRKDRYKPTKYLEQKQALFIKENGSYTQNEVKGLPLPVGHFVVEDLEDQNDDGNQVATKWQPLVDAGKVRLGKVRLGKVSSEDGADAPDTPTTKRFIKPTIEEIKNYCLERNNKIKADRFYDFYESKGWKVGKNPMKDWKACVRTWEQRDGDVKTQNQNSNVLVSDHSNKILEAMKKKTK